MQFIALKHATEVWIGNILTDQLLDNGGNLEKNNKNKLQTLHLRYLLQLNAVEIVETIQRHRVNISLQLLDAKS